MKEKIKLKDLYFGYVGFRMSYGSQEEKNKLETYNLFDNIRVLRSVAMYVVMSPEERKERVRDPLFWCFGEVEGRIEYEYGIVRWLDNDMEPKKVDVYDLYVVPNKDLLLDLISKVSKNSAQEFLREERKKYNR